MKAKKKIVLIGLLGVLVLFLTGITYSLFTSGTKMLSTNQGIASFIFETQNLDTIGLDLSDLKPGDKKEYLFSVTNAKKEKTSDITVDYQLTIKTYHFIPITINLYKILDEETEEFVGKCDETASSNSENKWVCNMPISTLSNTVEQTDNYKLEISFPVEYSDVLYANLVDFIDIEIYSWQKI